MARQSGFLFEVTLVFSNVDTIKAVWLMNSTGMSSPNCERGVWEQWEPRPSAELSRRGWTCTILIRWRLPSDGTAG